jgi:hypothetical protein
MKQAVNFRLNHQAIIALSLLEKQLRASKTAIIERALAFYAKKELADQKSILQYAGILNEQEAQVMLDTIQSSKHNKDIEIDL